MTRETFHGLYETKFDGQDEYSDGMKGLVEEEEKESRESGLWRGWQDDGLCFSLSGDRQASSKDLPCSPMAEQKGKFQKP